MMPNRTALSSLPRPSGALCKSVLGRSRPLVSSWSGLSRPPIPARAAIGSLDKPGHDDPRGLSGAGRR